MEADRCRRRIPERRNGSTELRLLRPHHFRSTGDAAPLEDSRFRGQLRAGRSRRTDVRREVFSRCCQGAYGRFGEESSGKFERTHQQPGLDER